MEVTEVKCKFGARAQVPLVFAAQCVFYRPQVLTLGRKLTSSRSCRDAPTRWPSPGPALTPRRLYALVANSSQLFLLQRIAHSHLEQTYLEMLEIFLQGGSFLSQWLRCLQGTPRVPFMLQSSPRDWAEDFSRPLSPPCFFLCRVLLPSFLTLPPECMPLRNH